MANTFRYQEDWDTKLAARLDKPQNWKDVCDVRYSDTQTLNLPYIATTGEPKFYGDTNSNSGYMTTAAARSTLSNVIPFVDVTESTETLQIITMDVDNVYIDFADQAQSNYAKQMQMADLLGKKTGERIEQLVLGNYAAWTSLGDDGTGNPGLSSSNFTVSETNIDNLIRGIIEQIQTANGFNLYAQNGGFAIWRPGDWTKLTTFMQANGYSFADEALRDPNGRMGKEAMGLFHYVSTGHTAGHLMAGVRGVQIFAVLNSTFGKTYTVDHPASSTAGFLSGTAVYRRLDYGMKVQTNLKPTIFNVCVA